MYEKYLKVLPSDKYNGSGIFSMTDIRPNLPIIEAMGTVLTRKELPNPNDPVLLQVGPNTFMCSSGHMVPDYINHSCDPNCYFYVVGNRAILFSMYLITAGMELTFDYSTTSNESKEEWKMECKCGSFKCRKEISGFQYLDSTTQDFYKKKNILPIYITLPIIQSR